MLRFALLLGLFAALAPAASAQHTLVYEGGEGPGKGKHVVLLSGDEEYRSEEAMPMLARILSKHHGFKCTVVFAIDPKTGEIDPNVNNNIPGIEALDDADLAIFFLRWRNLPPEQMKHVDDYLKAGKPVIGVRTSTHAFKFPAGHPYGRWDWQSKAPGYEQGFGRAILGETWIAHHGAHGKEATRGVAPNSREIHPLLRGVDDVFGPSDVYTVRLPLPGDSQTLLLGAVLTGMNPTDKPLEGKKNSPMMPVAWTKSYTVDGKTGKAFSTTMGSSQDLSSEGFRRLLVNATYGLLGLDVPQSAKVDLVGDYNPSPFKFNGARKGIKPADYAKMDSPIPAK